jgi:probable phosphoglycerate mutase
LQAFLADLNENCLLLARHGETDWNAMNIIQGQQDRPLNARGFEQRKHLFFMLSQVVLWRICCSALQRTIQTAIPISMERGIPLEEMSALNEVRLGVLEGQYKDVPDNSSRTYYQSSLHDEVNVAPPGGGENLKMAAERVRGVVESCVETVVNSGHVLIVGHRNINKMIVRQLMNLSIEEGYRVEHMNSSLYLYAPRTSDLFLVSIPAPQEPIEVYVGYEADEGVSTHSNWPSIPG